MKNEVQRIAEANIMIDASPDEFLGAQIIFGLEAQGHIPTIEKMLAEGRNWEEIANTIGWCQVTAREHYERFTRKNQENEVFSLLARAVEMLRKVGDGLDESWERNPISEFIFRAEKHLNSTSTKRHPILKSKD